MVEVREPVHKCNFVLSAAACGASGFWLAIKSACPIFIKRSVWDECSTEVEAEGGGGLDEALAKFRAIRCRLPQAATCMYLCSGHRQPGRHLPVFVLLRPRQAAQEQK